MESIYFKILGVSLVMTVSCGAKMLLNDATNTDYTLKNCSLSSHNISISSVDQYDISDIESNLNFVIYLLDLQCKKEVELNQILNGSTAQSYSSTDTFSKSNTTSPAWLNANADADILLPSSNRYQPVVVHNLPLQLLTTKNPVRAGPFAA